ncbi:protein of unknown function [Candidatus Filomicrobium marinum]|uniref:Uncharacterized protein n=1 Tax=Candidatus Filomicrobium marinum TaxID=1608628 RepID=A0A0D6JI82_9HYPH|nr:protein of unknown function [Candidatus Filomicrobium marinum]
MGKVASRKELIRAIDLILSGENDKAHAIVQKNDTDANACYIHAVLHRLEGDKENAKYWYGRAGHHEWPASDPEGQLLRLRDDLLFQP